MSEQIQRAPEVVPMDMDAPPKVAKSVFTISVRDLVEYAWRTGDLGGDRDFVSPTRAIEGTRGHQRLQKSRPPRYAKEVSLQYEVETPHFILRIQGRVDGIMPWETGTGQYAGEGVGQASAQGLSPEACPVLLEEIKTVYHTWKGEADPLHWAQVKIYGAMYLVAHPSNKLALRLVYLDLETGLTREFQRDFPGVELVAFFESALTPYR
jgi:DNA excision repair protein ERCC-2